MTTPKERTSRTRNMSDISGPTGHPALPDLGDTRIAFAAKSDAELWKAQQLYRIIGNPAITAVGSWLTKASLALHLPIKGVVKATIFQQFCGGETIEESLSTATRLAKSGVGTILDHSVEGQEDEDTLDHTVQEILRTIAVAKQRTDIPFCVFKPTGVARFAMLEKASAGKLVAEDQAEWARVEARMERICASAHAAGCARAGGRRGELDTTGDRHDGGAHDGPLQSRPRHCVQYGTAVSA